MEPIINSSTVGYVLVGLATCLTTIIVAVIAKRTAPKIKLRTPQNYAGYEKWAAYMEKELKAARDLNEKQAQRIETLQEALDKMKVQLTTEQRQKRRMRYKLLELARVYNVDVSDVIQ